MNPVTSTCRLEREIERERDERHKHDDAKAGVSSEEALRIKDARDNASSGQLHRSGGR